MAQRKSRSGLTRAGGRHRGMTILEAAEGAGKEIPTPVTWTGSPRWEPALVRVEVAHWSPAAGLHHAGAGWHVGDHGLGAAYAIPADGDRLLLVERNHVCSVCVSNGTASCNRSPNRWASAACGIHTIIRGCRWISRIRLRAGSQPLRAVHAVRARLCEVEGAHVWEGPTAD